MTSGPVVAMVWEGKGVVATGRKMLGATNPGQYTCYTKHLVVLCATLARMQYLSPYKITNTHDTSYFLLSLLIHS